MNGIPKSLYQFLKRKELGYILKITDQSHYFAAVLNCSQLYLITVYLYSLRNTIPLVRPKPRSVKALNKYIEKKGKNKLYCSFVDLRKHSIRYLECNFDISYYNII